MKRSTLIVVENAPHRSAIGQNHVAGRFWFFLGNSALSR